MDRIINIIKGRPDLSIISTWIEPNSSVLDIGCGDGILLEYLMKNKSVKGMGIERDLDSIIEAVKRKIPVIQQDLNKGIDNFEIKSFDYVILSQTIQEVKRPDILIESILKIGKNCIVTFPNFGYIYLRSYLLLTGKMPKSKILAHEWYNTPNIHLMTYRNFKEFCIEKKIKILNTIFIRREKYSKKLLLPNLLSENCLFLITKDLEH